MGGAAHRPRRPARREELARPARPPDPFDGRLRRPGLEGQPDPRAVERRQPADRPLLRDADRPDQLLPDELAGRPAVRLARARLQVPGPVGADGIRLPPRLRRDPRERRRQATGLNEAVAWSVDLGQGYRVALVQAGTFWSDAGALFGPVPRILWDRLVTDELTADWRLGQALNCLLVETPSGRVLVETGIGERGNDKTRERRRYSGDPILPALR